MPRLRVSRFSCGFLRFDPAVFVPDRPRGTQGSGPVPFYLVEHPAGLVLIDTGCHPAVVTSPEKAWGGLTRAFYPVVREEELADRQLRAAGFAPGEIATVISTHLHMDHCGGNQLFPSARFLVSEVEWNAVQDTALEGQGYFRSDWDHPLDYVKVQDGHDVFGDGAIRLLLLPGHSPGHLSVVLQGERTLVLAIDAAPMQENIDGAVPRNSWDKALFARSAGILRELRASGAQIICGHDQAQWDALPADPLEV